uniref:Miff domain-containing protein n=1 Tax=Macrostomum lignano TaxID=282301 RepID=A0A1I8H9N4_9PLAT
MDSGQFTEDISRQMRIPDRLGPMADRDYEALHTDTDGGFSRAAQQQPAFLGALDLMSVPDRLLATLCPRQPTILTILIVVTIATPGLTRAAGLSLRTRL